MEIWGNNMNMDYDSIIRLCNQMQQRCNQMEDTLKKLEGSLNVYSTVNKDNIAERVAQSINLIKQNLKTCRETIKDKTEVVSDMSRGLKNEED